MPSATASRFMVPPAEITRSAKAIRLCASTARSGTMKPAERLDLRALSGRAGQHHGLRVRAAVRARARRAGSRSGGRATPRAGCAPRTIGSRAVQAQLGEHRVVGLEVGQVVLLLQPLVAGAPCPARRSGRGARAGSRRAPPPPAPGGSSRCAGRWPTRSRTPWRWGSAAARRPPSRRWSRGPSPRRSARGRAQRASAPLRLSRPSPCWRSRPPRWRPMAVWAMPKRSHSSSVWAKSRAVTSTSCPSSRMASISGRMTSTWGQLVRSTQTRTPRPPRGPRPRIELRCPSAAPGWCGRPRRCPAARPSARSAPWRAGGATGTR